MSKRLVPVAFAGLTLIGCAAPAPSSSDVAMDPEIAQTWQSLTSVQSCTESNLNCIAEAGLNPFEQAQCALDYTDCLATTGLDGAQAALDCTLEDVGCTFDGVGELDPNYVIDCQQAVVDCSADVVNGVAEVDLSEVVDVVNGTVDDVQDTVDQVGGVVEDAAGNAVDTVLSQADCNDAAARCLAENLFSFRGTLSCQADFVDCSAQVVEDAVGDAVGTVQDTVDIVTGPQDCSGVYTDCRASGKSVLACIRVRRECESN